MKNIGTFVNWLSAYVITLCFIFFFCSVWMPAADKDIKLQVSAIIGNITMLVVGYIWGSSASSAKKNDTINKLLTPDEPTETIVEVKKENDVKTYRP